MKENAHVTQYTLRSVSAHIDRALRRMAKQQDKSMNQLILDVLERVVGASTEVPAPSFQDLDPLVGSWIEDSETDKAFAAQSKIDKDLWK